MLNDAEPPPRPIVMGSNGMVTTGHAFASRAAATLFGKGRIRRSRIVAYGSEADRQSFERGHRPRWGRPVQAQGQRRVAGGWRCLAAEGAWW